MDDDLFAGAMDPSVGHRELRPFATLGRRSPRARAARLGARLFFRMPPWRVGTLPPKASEPHPPSWWS